MVGGERVLVVLPAYNAEKTLEVRNDSLFAAHARLEVNVRREPAQPLAQRSVL